MPYKTSYDEEVRSLVNAGKSMRQVAKQMHLTKSKIETSLRRTRDTLSEADVATARGAISVESQSVLKKIKRLPSGSGKNNNKGKVNKITKNTLQSFYATHLINAQNEDMRANAELTKMQDKIKKVHSGGGIISKQLRDDIALDLEILKAKKMLACKTFDNVNTAINSIIKIKNAGWIDVDFSDISKTIARENEDKEMPPELAERLSKILKGNVRLSED